MSVAAEVGTRSGEQCAKRWNDYVNPDLDHSPWSTQEDQRLLPIVALYGHNWKHIAENFLPTRSPLSIKNHYALLMRRQKRQNARHQQRTTANTELPKLHTPPSGNHPPCNLESFIASGSETSQSNGTADMAELFSTGTLLGGAGQVFDDGQPRIQDITSTQWQDEHSLCNNLDLSGLFTISADGSVDDGRQSSSPGNGSDKGLEFSITCSRSRLKAMVCHVFEGAMSETAGLSEEEPVTVTLRLKK